MFHPPNTAQGPGYEVPFYQEPTSFPADPAPITPVLVGPSFVYTSKFNAQFIFLQRANKRNSPIRHRIITPDEDIRRLFQECVIGRGNAGLLSEALAHSKPEDLKKKDVIKVYHVLTIEMYFNMAVLRSSMISVGYLKSSYVPKFLGHQPVRNIHVP